MFVYLSISCPRSLSDLGGSSFAPGFYPTAGDAAPEAFGSAACSHEMASVNCSAVQELTQGHLPARFALLLQTCSGHWDAPVPWCEPRGSQRLLSPTNLLLSASGGALLFLTFSSYWLSELLGFPCLALFCFLTWDFFFPVLISQSSHSLS